MSSLHSYWTRHQFQYTARNSWARRWLDLEWWQWCYSPSLSWSLDDHNLRPFIVWPANILTQRMTSHRQSKEIFVRSPRSVALQRETCMRKSIFYNYPQRSLSRRISETYHSEVTVLSRHAEAGISPYLNMPVSFLVSWRQPNCRTISLHEAIRAEIISGDKSMPAGAFMWYIQLNNKKASAMGFDRESWESLKIHKLMIDFSRQDGRAWHCDKSRRLDMWDDTTLSGHSSGDIRMCPVRRCPSTRQWISFISSIFIGATLHHSVAWLY